MIAQDDNLPNETFDDASSALDLETDAYDPTPLSFDEFDRQTSASAATNREIQQETPINLAATSVSLSDDSTLSNAEDVGSTVGAREDVKARLPEATRERESGDVASSERVELAQFLSSEGEGSVKIDLRIESSVKTGPPKRNKTRPRQEAERATQAPDTSGFAKTATVAPPFPKSSPTPAPDAPPPRQSAPSLEPSRLQLPKSELRKPYDFANPLANDSTFSSPLRTAKSRTPPSADAKSGKSAHGQMQPEGKKSGNSGCVGLLLFLAVVILIVKPGSAASVIPLFFILIVSFLAFSAASKPK